MLKKIKRQDCLDKYSKFPLRWYNDIKEEDEYYYPKVYYSYILTLPSKSISQKIKLLGIELTNLTDVLGFTNLIFLGDNNTAWRYQESDYKPVRKALQFLVENKIGKKFNGAFQVDKKNLRTFITHLSWLSRCNAALPYFYFTDTGQNIIGTICQYGNLHIDTVNKKTDVFFKDLIAKSQFEFLIDKMCYDQFSKTKGIKGRQIKL